jgi:hypothetical protein
MPTRAQAKTAIDNAAAFLKSDIDAILPTAANIRDGEITFVPTRGIIKLDAQGDEQTANTWKDILMNNLTNASRLPRLEVWRRATDGVTEKTYKITTTAVTYFIVNF